MRCSPHVVAHRANWFSKVSPPSSPKNRPPPSQTDSPAPARGQRKAGGAWRGQGGRAGECRAKKEKGRCVKKPWACSFRTQKNIQTVTPPAANDSGCRNWRGWRPARRRRRATGRISAARRRPHLVWTPSPACVASPGERGVTRVCQQTRGERSACVFFLQESLKRKQNHHPLPTTTHSLITCPSPPPSPSPSWPPHSLQPARPPCLCRPKCGSAQSRPPPASRSPPPLCPG